MATDEQITVRVLEYEGESFIELDGLLALRIGESAEWVNLNAVLLRAIAQRRGCRTAELLVHSGGRLRITVDLLSEPSLEQRAEA